MKTNLQVKFYPSDETEHSRWGQAMHALELTCHVPDGQTFVDIKKEKNIREILRLKLNKLEERGLNGNYDNDADESDRYHVFQRCFSLLVPAHRTHSESLEKRLNRSVERGLVGNSKTVQYRGILFASPDESSF
ncbi:hypothetical protein BaRGS_00036679 [Batillaria attramentaria]|uniref:Uncharacterized protein n=1 Tax=Batillaria attramentaria TaxID=370345 RepID=A0ABD0JB78_9CAEN